MEPVQYSKIYRLLHWAIAISLFIMILTIFLRSTWMNKNNMAAIIQNYITEENISLTHEQTIALAKKIRNPMWNWHIYIGYVLTGLFSIRFSLPLFGVMKFQNPLTKGLSAQEKIKKWSYIIFYLCIVISLTTGLVMEFGPKELGKPSEKIHVLGIYYLIAFIGIHWAGVLRAEFTDQKGIISKIIRGSKK